MIKKLLFKVKKALSPYGKRLIALIVILITALLLGVYKDVAVASLPDQNGWRSWLDDGSYGQISIYFNHSLSVTPDSIREYNYKILKALQEAALKEEGDELVYCYSAPGSVTITRGSKSVDVKAMGVGGKFFYLHPSMLIKGSYFDPEAQMKDQIVVDEDTAWTLFGSSDIIGQAVDIGGIPHYICGVVRRQSGKIAKAAGLDKPIVYVSFQTLVIYGSVDSSSFDAGQIQSIDPNEEGMYTYSGSDSQDGSGGSSSEGSALGGSASGSSSSGGAGAGTSSAPPGNAPSTGESGQSGDGGAGSPDTASSVSEASPSTSSDNGAADGTSSADSSKETAESTTGTGSATSQGSSYSGGSYSSGSSGSAPDVILPLSYGERADAESISIISTNLSSVAGIASYELIMPDSVDNYATNLVKEKLGFKDHDDIVVMDSRTRFSFGSLISIFKSFPARSMQLTEFSYPYWENIARGWEDILALVVMAQLLLYIIDFLLLVWIIVSWYNNRTWRTRDIVKKVSDTIYDYQSHKKRRKSNGKIKKTS